MCDRFTLSASSQELRDHFRLPYVPDVAPRSTIVPRQPIAIVANSETGTRFCVFARWGFIHGDSASIPEYVPPFARAETVDRLWLFAEAFRTQRCLIPANGWYKLMGQYSEPRFVELRGRALMAFGGIWSVWKPQPDSRSVATAAIIATNPTQALQPIHKRMPVVLRPEDYAKWLDLDTPIAELKKLMEPFTAKPLEMSAVDPNINSWKPDPELVIPRDAILCPEL